MHKHFALLGASMLVLAAAPATAEDERGADIVVTARKSVSQDQPATRASIDAATIAATVNAVNVEDTLKYLPSLLVRKRHIGDTQAPLATRTNGVGASARSLVYADGALLSALIGNNNTNASPRWGLVSPQEIARIDVLYGPYSAAYPGNAIGAVVTITTRLPERLEATITAGTNLQTYDQYGTHEKLPAYQLGATLGDRFGPLALFGSYDHVTSNSQPVLFVTASRPATASGAGTPVTGGYDDVNRTGAPIRVLGASGIEHQQQDRFKLKAALDVTSAIRLTYVGGLFRNDTDAVAQTYLRDAAGTPVFAGTVNSDGRAYTLAPAAFSGGTYAFDERHWSHALSATGIGAVDWQVIGTLYDYAHSVQRSPTVVLPAAHGGGAGTITRLDGTGWATLDAKASFDATPAHRIGLGAHLDRFELASDRYATDDWISGREGQLNLASRGKTRTAALWAQDAWRVAQAVTLTLGGRYEWWRAYDGSNFSLAPAIAATQPVLTAARFSPKASLAWDPSPAWTLRASFGTAWRFPTVGELYQIVTTPVAAVPNPNLRPERALSEELSAEHHDEHGSLRVSLFNESIRDALIAQTGPLNGTTTLATFVQNVGRTRARGVEAAVQRADIVPRFDLTGSVTYADATTRANAAFPASVGKRLPQVPQWKATLVGTWRPADGVSLTAAGRYASRFYGTLDNSDVVGNTYQGFYRYLVVDLRAQVRVGEHYTLGLGVDNVGNDRYFLFHPFPQRSFQADLTWTL
ncbi:TonB-dependent receptor [Sphingomonas ginsenosidivorax]|uniref:TonB-dependent receptor n=1 Tax=Sphingomonas ginsenosidivorax TaxID=862135 RepID=A0A5C6U8X9_9SPHN|nr:TonB-dependent receptor [Sphingomonas ginsenosidivorax]TXC69567.1 TonB-dependent receptor [Sphingomonas ginsenosidivorax]